jgi:hypothetical protein
LFGGSACHRVFLGAERQGAKEAKLTRQGSPAKARAASSGKVSSGKPA